MRDDSHTPSTPSFGIVLDWWQRARARWMRLHELDRLSSSEIDRMAQEVGLSGIEFLRVAIAPDGTAALLARRLAGLHLDPEAIRLISPLLLRDLQRACALCSEKQRCADDMAEDPNPVGWDSYCNNAGTLKTLT